MLKCPWNTAVDIQRYMGNCILMYDNFPYLTLFLDVREISLCKITEVNSASRKGLTVLLTDDRLDVTSPPLGYYNHDKQALRLERQPYKQFSQGLTDRNTVIYDVDDNRHYDDTIFCQGVEDMLVNKYPSFDEAWKLLDSQSSIALSRDVALGRPNVGFPTNVYYKGDIVGFINPDSHIVKVPSSERGWIISKYLDVFGWEVE